MKFSLEQERVLAVIRDVGTMNHHLDSNETRKSGRIEG